MLLNLFYWKSIVYGYIKVTLYEDFMKIFIESDNILF